MKTKDELNRNILQMTMKIRSEFPELSKYLAEMPITIPNENEPKMDTQHLTDYYESLVQLYDRYHKDHIGNSKEI